MPTRCMPLARLRVYPVGAKGYATDPGWAWYSPMASDFQQWANPQAVRYGSGAGSPIIDAFEMFTLGSRCVVIPRPCEYLWHMESAQWTQSAGTWEERVPHAASSLKFLYCLDNVGTLTSVFTHPEAPNFALSFSPDTPPYDWDTEDDPPYVSVSWGVDPVYQVMLYHWGGLFVTETTGGVTSILGGWNTSWKWGQGSKTEEEHIEFMVLHLLGGIVVRGGPGGDTYFAAGDGNIRPAAGGSFAISYRGGTADVNFHGVVGPESSVGAASTVNILTGPVIATDRIRGTDPGIGINTRLWIPTVTAPDVAPDLVVAAIDQTGTAQAQLDATFTWGAKVVVAPQADFPLSYTFCYFPELYATDCGWDPAVTEPINVPIEIYSDMINQIKVTLCDEAESSSATIDAVWHVNDLGAFADAMYMRVGDIGLGWRYDAGPDAITQVMVGYFSEVQIEQIGPLLVRVRARMVDVTQRLRQPECDENFPIMDGWDAEVAALHIAAKCGWGPALCDFSSCAGWTLSQGNPEGPLWKPGAGGTAWEIVERILRYCEQETAISAGGVVYSRPIAYFNIAFPVTFLSTQMRQEKSPLASRRHAFGYTGVVVYGRTVDGVPICSWRYDARAESDPTYVYFRGYRRLERFEDAAFTLQADVDVLAAIFYDSLAARSSDEFTWRTNAVEGIVPRSCCYLSGLATGVNVATLLGLTNIEHTWGARVRDCITDYAAVVVP